MTQQPRRRVLCIALMLAFGIAGRAAPVRAEEPGTIASGLGGLTAGVLTLLYTPLKIVYAAGGLAVTPLVYLYSVGDTKATGYVARNAIRGDWVVTPDHLGNGRSLHFFGES